MRTSILCIILLISVSGFSQQEDPKAREKALNNSNNLTYAANKDLSENNFVEAEANYRKAISTDGENTAAKYNMGNAYYRENSLDEAFSRYKQASEVAQTKAEKHKTYHNIGNVSMKNKAYEKAVEAYKEALRNNPNDEETRYNLALAKEMLKKQQEDQKNDQNKENQDKDQKDKEKDKKDDQGDQEDKNEDQNKDGDQQKQEENKDGKGDKEEDKKNQEQKEDPSKEEQDKAQPRPNQLSPQQIKNILEAMNNEEKKVQEKMNAKKVKGIPVKSEKDW